MKIPKVRVYGDSNFLIKQVNGEFAVKEPSLANYRDEIQKRLLNFENYGLETVPRSKNKYADALATLVPKMAQVEEDIIRIPLEVKQEPISVSEVEESEWI